MFPTVFAIALATAAETGLADTAAESNPTAWNLDEGAHHRWAIDTEVVIPGHSWVYADRNIDVRARNIGVQMVFDCIAGAPTKQAGILRCTVKDAAVTGATYPSERGRLQPILEEMDAKLTGATAEIVMRRNGRIRTVKLRSNRLVGFRNQRTRYMEEMLRILVVRAVAPFDLVIPREGIPEEAWPQYESLLLQLPGMRGTAGSGKLVHNARSHDAERFVVSTFGEAMLIDGSLIDRNVPLYLRTQLTGFTVFDTRNGEVSEAVWTGYGEPTASAGLFAQAYATKTTLRSLDPGEEVELEPTREWSPPIRGVMGFRDEMVGRNGY